MTAIVLPGLANNDPTPGVYVYNAYAQGPVGGDETDLPILILANKLASGSATADTKIYGPDTDPPLQSETDMIALGGSGCEAHRLWRRVTKVNKTTAVYVVFVTESAGTQATGTVVIATTATGAGALRLWVGDEFVEAGISTNMTPTQIGDALVTAVNGQTHWAVTAANVTGTVTLTAKQKGPRGNDIRYQTTITSGIGTTASAGTDTALSGGATADSNVTALGTILSKQFYRIVSAAPDATQLGALTSQVNTQALPVTGILQRVFAGSVDTLANTITLATGLNAALSEIAWSEKSPLTPGELAANQAAVVSLFETRPNPRTNFANFGNDAETQPTWKVPKPRLDSAHPSRSSIVSALNNGISPIAVNPNGTTYLVNRITTRSLSGSTVDYRIRASHKVTISHFYAFDLRAKLTLQFSGKRIGNDVAQGERLPGPSVATPTIIKGAVNALTDDYDRNDLLQPGRARVIKDTTIVQRETSPSTRMGIYIPLEPVDNLEQIAAIVSQVA